MAEKSKTKIDYFPREHFWKFWEKRKASQIVTWTKNGDGTKKEVTHFRADGSKEDHYVYLKDGKGSITSYTSEEYYPNGQISCQFSSDPFIEKTFYKNGGLAKITTKDTETRYFESGKVQSVRTLTSQKGIAEYIEYTEKGALKKKGLLKAPHGFAAGSIQSFVTGNMEEKGKDTFRQKLNVAIESIDRNMPATEERKMAKREIVKAYRKSKGSR